MQLLHRVLHEQQTQLDASTRVKALGSAHACILASCASCNFACIQGGLPDAQRRRMMWDGIFGTRCHMK